jgi:hypothetical protein
LPLIIVEFGVISQVISLETFSPHVTEDNLVHLANGCGPEGLGLLVPDFDYTELCSLHDLFYCIGFSDDAKSIIDTWFLARLEAAGAGDMLLGAIALALDKVNYMPKRSRGPFARMPKEELALLKYRLIAEVLDELSVLTSQRRVAAA